MGPFKTENSTHVLSQKKTWTVHNIVYLQDCFEKVAKYRIKTVFNARRRLLCVMPSISTAASAHMNSLVQKSGQRLLAGYIYILILKHLTDTVRIDIRVGRKSLILEISKRLVLYACKIVTKKLCQNFKALDQYLHLPQAK